MPMGLEAKEQPIPRAHSDFVNGIIAGEFQGVPPCFSTDPQSEKASSYGRSVATR